ncbi:S8 family serine peptidase [Pseudomonas sp. MOIL14HWK12:I2]|uniref:S8 family serine peptidase n=1 Tax=Pseudomonas sp. MOIL14HWK12:I2 TaxID=1033994 RepID=UPI000420FBD0|nr:S8 family serine peptidase [Pseudomonas sp. MOIL14HWK12:I2]
MAAGNGKPIANPILSFLQEPSPTAIKGGGKGEKDILKARLDSQRKKLHESFTSFAARRDQIKHHAFKTHLIVRMDEKSHAPTWTPKDIFSSDTGSRVIAPAYNGYLVESDIRSFELLAKKIITTKTINNRVDISRVDSAELFSETETLRGKTAEELWKETEEKEKQFSFWLLPFTDEESRRSAVNTLYEICKSEDFTLGHKEFSGIFADIAETDSQKYSIDPELVKIFANYIKNGNASFSAQIKELKTLHAIAASGTTYRIEPIQRLMANEIHPGTGPEPSIASIKPDGLPIVVVVDGGRTALSYAPFEHRAAPPLIDLTSANGVHGNQVTSLVCNGFAWNNNLSLPELHCKFLTARAIAKNGVQKQPTQTQFLSYLRGLAKDTAGEAKVWNLSFNEILPNFNSNEISLLGHEINKIAREYGILPVISIGNVSNANKSKLCPPADCESALTVSGRQASAGVPSTACNVSLKGPAPAGMKKPDVSWFSELRVIGGVIAKGTSYAAPLVSSLAAHTFSNLKAPTADLVRALLINNSDLNAHCNELGWGTPWTAEALPWLCKEGTVTLAWVSMLNAGSAYYWNDLPIPPEMLANGNLTGKISLTAIIKPRVSDLGSDNYFATRLQVALQARNGKDSIVNLLGTMQESKTKEENARKELAKWSPIRRHANSFKSKFVKPGSMRLHARIYTRDLYQFGLNSHHELEKQEVAFVLTFEAPNGEPSIYNSLRSQLATRVEYATTQDINVDTDIDI